MTSVHLLSEPVMTQTLVAGSVFTPCTDDAGTEPAGCLQLVEPGHAARPALEQFIRQGFAAHYHANVQRLMPYLVGFRADQRWQAALGIRFAAQEKLFTEQYLAVPVEAHACVLGLADSRGDIAEIGNLLATSRHAVMPLFVLTVQALHQLGLSCLVFTATADLKKMLAHHGIELHEIGAADPVALGDAAADWGTYYDTRPTVCLLSLAQAADRIRSDQRLQQRIHRHWPALHVLVNRLKEFA